MTAADDYAPDDRDDSDAALDHVMQARRENALAAIYNAGMFGLGDEDIDTLLFECGLSREELNAYVQPVLRPINQRSQSTLDLNCPF